MFAQCSVSSTRRALAEVNATEDVILGRPVDEETGGWYWLVKVVNRTAGDITIGVLGSIDGITYYPLNNVIQQVVSGDGTYYLPLLEGAVPPYIGVRLNPGVGFDGLVEVIARSQGRITTEIPGQI